MIQGIYTLTYTIIAPSTVHPDKALKQPYHVPPETKGYTRHKHHIPGQWLRPYQDQAQAQATIPGKQDQDRTRTRHKGGAITTRTIPGIPYIQPFTKWLRHINIPGSLLNYVVQLIISPYNLEIAIDLLSNKTWKNA